MVFMINTKINTKKKLFGIGLRLISLLLILLLLVSCAHEYALKNSSNEYKTSPSPREDKKVETSYSSELIDAKLITLKTEDGKNIFGKYYRTNSSTIIILLHMLDKDHNSWDKFAEELYLLNYSVIAIDFRGHGKSSGKWENFNIEDFNSMILDVKEAKEFGLLEKKSNFVIIGASIGANIALNYAATDKEVKGVALLSPGLDYHGVKIDVATLNYGQRSILLAASEDDKYSADTVRELSSKLVGKKKLVMYKAAGHGTDMFVNEPKLENEIIEWLNENNS